MSEQQYYVGIDIGGTNIKYGLFDDHGKVLYKEQRPTLVEKGPMPLMHLITNISERLLDYAAEEDYHIKWLGVGSPGAVDNKSGTVIGPCPNIKGWQGMEIGIILSEHLNMPVYVDNDVNAMALAELRFGAAMGAKSVVCATVGTGIGGAVIIDGKVWHGANATAGELGHITINMNGPKCACGNNGCIEAYCSSQMIIETVKSRLNNNMTPIFNDILEGNLDNLNIKKIFSAVKRKDEIALEVIHATAEYLGIGMAGIVNLLNPEIVVLGGGIVDGGGDFIEVVTKTIKEHAFSSAVEKLRVTKAALGNDAGFIGAGLLGLVNQ